MPDRPQTSGVRIGDWLVMPALDQIERAGETVKLEPRTMRLLIRLSETPGEVVSGQQLLDDVWTGVVVSSQSVYQAISQLRKLLGDVDEAPTYIATIPRKGYRLIAPVRKLELEAPPPRSAEEDLSGSSPSVALLPPVPPGEAAWVRARRGWASASAAAVALLALVSYLWLRDSWQADIRRTAVVVLPFVDMTDGQKDAAFTDGLTEELSTSLSQLPALRVIARTSAYAVRDQKLDARQIGEKLSATHIIEGTVRRSGDVVRVTAQLVDAGRGHRSWSEIYELPAKDLLRLQADIAKSVAQALELRFSEQEARRLSARSPKSAEAYELYLLGRHYYRQRTAEANARAIELNRRALELDPKFALAYVALAQAKLNDTVLREIPVQQLAPEIEGLLASALSLNAQLAEAYAVRGLLYRHLDQFDLAKRDLAAAVRLDPNNVAAVSGLGVLTEYEGKPLLALGYHDRAAEIDPLDFMRHVSRCICLNDAGKYQLAEAACAQARSIKPDSEWVYLASSWIARARGQLATSLTWNDAGLAAAPDSMELLIHRLDDLENLGMLRDARAVIARAQLLAPDSQWPRLSDVGVALLDGREDEARRQLASLDLNQSAVGLSHAASLRLMMRDPQAAERLVQLADDAPDATRVKLLNVTSLRWGFSSQVTLASAEKALGRQERASARMKTLLADLAALEGNGVQSWGIPSLRADALAILDDPDGAMNALEQAVELGWRRTYYVRRAPHFTPLASRPEFQQLLARVDSLVAAERGRYEAAR